VAISRRDRLPTHLSFNPRDFPDLTTKNHRVASGKRDGQNCIAFAAGDDIHYWWPIPDPAFPGKYKPPYYWPPGCPEEENLAAFECAFATVGFEPCNDGIREPGYVKIAIFAHGQPGNPRAIVQHAARQSPHEQRQWRSKMGVDYDVDHDLTAVEGPLYGIVVRFMRKRIRRRRGRRGRGRGRRSLGVF
jgi:hypothetical protein